MTDCAVWNLLGLTAGPYERPREQQSMLEML